MTKKLLLVPAFAGLCVIATGCASSFPQGIAYTNIKLPVTATEGAASTKVGRAESVSYFGMVTTGDSSIEAAKKNGGISKVSHVDWEADNILGIYGKYRVVVYGE